MKYNTFLGKRMAQSELAIPMWESVMFHTDYCRIIEIGTFHGNFSLYLFLLTLSNQSEFYTFDIVDWRVYDHSPHIKNYLGLDNHFKKMDVFESVGFISDLIKRNGISVLFCDGGDKEREFNTFSPFLKWGDIIAVHDWGTEVNPENLNLEGFEDITPINDDGMTKFFKKI